MENYLHRQQLLIGILTQIWICMHTHTYTHTYTLSCTVFHSTCSVGPD